jgi:hypothetical protein
MPSDNAPEVRFAVVGETGCGKTTLLASYYGTQTTGSWEKKHGYSLLAEDAAQGNELTSRFLGLKNGRFPRPDTYFSQYRFNLCLTGLPNPVLRIRWYDYPGGWWTAPGGTPQEEETRKEAISQLLSCDVGFLVFDGERVREEGSKYLVKVLNQFRDNVRRHRQELAQGGKAFDEYPKEWVFVLSKADLFSDEHSAQQFQESIYHNASEAVDDLKSEFPDASGIATRFLLLSSVKAEGRRIIDPQTSLGLNLVAPLAFLSSLRKVKGMPPLLIKTLEYLAVAVEHTPAFIEFLVLLGLLKRGKIPRGGYFKRIIAYIVSKLGRKSFDYENWARGLQEMARKLAKKGETLAAACLAMANELIEEHSRRLFFALDQRVPGVTRPEDLTQVVNNWGALPAEVKADILAMVHKETA